jgi:protein-tyrosine phosphatase
VRILLVSEDDRARGPAAAALLSRELTRRGVTDVAVSSAGVHARTGDGLRFTMSWAASEQGLSLHAHRARALEEELVAEADLILTMTRSQADHVGMHHHRVGDRLFLVGELAALLRMGTDDVPAATAGTTFPVAAPVTSPSAAAAAAASAGVVVTPTLRHAPMLALARTRRIVRGLRDDDIVADDHPDAPRTLVARLRADLATIAEHLVG